MVRSPLARSLPHQSPASEINPSYAKAYNIRARAFASKGEHDPAITDYTKAIELNPQDVIAYYDSGNVFCRRGRL
jgi:Tfp pilus assembly protein PilF